MFVRVKASKNSPRKTVQIVASVREKDRVIQKTIRYIGVANDEKELELILQLAETIKTKIENEAHPSLFSPDEMANLQKKSDEDSIVEGLNKEGQNFKVDLRDLEEEDRVIEGIHDVYGTLFEQLGLDLLFKEREGRSGDIFKEMVLTRIASPKSKLATTELLQRSFGTRLDVNAIYRMMDRIDEKRITKLQEIIYRETVSLFKQELDVIFFDVTTLYYESFEEDDFRKNGYSKDLKFNQPQVVLALMVTEQGLPIGYEVFPGNTFEGHTFIPCMNKLRNKYGVKRVVFVADSGMCCQDNLTALVENGFEYIIGARLKNVSKPLQEKILTVSGYSSINDHEAILEESFQTGERLILNFSTDRARKNRSDRKRAILKIQKKLQNKKTIPAKDLLNNYGYKKYLQESGNGTLTLNDQKILEDERWDGLMGVRSNSKNLTPLQIIRQYQQLFVIEEAFRLNKHHLEIRPIYHFKKERIKAHIAICFAAFSLISHLRYRVKLQQTELSVDRIREALLSVQTSLLFNKKNRLRYSFPSKISEDAKKIYKVLNLSKNRTPKILAS